jgi:hypothetical protein
LHAVIREDQLKTNRRSSEEYLMARAIRWRTVVGVLALSGGAFLATGSATGSAALAEPAPAPAAEQLELRVVVDDDCPAKAAGAVQP